MSSPTPLVPPRPERRPTVLEAHGDKRVDDWYWIRDRDDPGVLDHLRAERAYADAVLERLQPLQEGLFQEIKARVVETDLSVPVRLGPWWYYHRTEEGKSYGIHCRRPVAGDDPPLDVEPSPDEEVLLDENLLAEGHEYLAVANLTVSPDHRMLAFGVDTSGAELYDLRFRSLDGEDVAPETIPGTYYGFAWASDNATAFYTRVDHAMRPYQVWRHRLGTDPGTDELVFQEDDEHFTVSLGRTKDRVFVVIALESRTTSEWWVIPTDAPDSPPRVVLRRRRDVTYSLEHHRGWFVALTNEDAEDFRVVAMPAGVHDSAAQQLEIVPHRRGVRIEDVDVFDSWLVVAERLEGEPVLRVLEIPDAGVTALAGNGTTGQLVHATDHPSATWEGPNPEPGSAYLRIEETSLVEPRTVADVDFGSGKMTIRKRQPVIGYDPTAYRTFRLWAKASDGVRVPISIVHRRDLLEDPDAPPGTAPDVPAPCPLYGYGAYEVSIDPAFSSLRLSLVDRGVIFAIAHVRGGGELGRHWWLDGRLGAKEHTFSDFIACAEHLVEARFTAPDRLAARGRSAGGLLMGAIANQAPDLFAAVVAEVPFVDCLTTMLDETVPLTVGEFEEWGDPIRDPDAYAAIKAYSPYDNVGPGRHPRILTTGGFNDPRVGFWEPAKWTAKLRDVGADVVFRPELGLGHGGRSGRYDAWREEALVYAYLLDAIGAAGVPAATPAPVSP